MPSVAPRSLALPALSLAVLLAATGCGSDDTTDTAAQKASVKAGDTTCDVSQTTFDAGKVTLAVENTGKDVTEVYVYGKGSSEEFDKVIGEVENVAPGTSRDFEVSVGGGEYEVACKPGQKGDGIRTEIHVTGAGASHSVAAYDREVEVEATDFAFSGLEGFTAKAGEKIEFKLENKGRTVHNLEVFDPAGNEIGEVDDVSPVGDGEAIITLEKAGTYTFLCGVGKHAEQGMKGSFTVTAS